MRNDLPLSWKARSYIERRNTGFNLRIRRRVEKNSGVSSRGPSETEMLFPFYFRSGTDKIDEKRSWWKGGVAVRSLVKGWKSTLVHYSLPRFWLVRNKDRGTTTQSQRLSPYAFRPSPSARETRGTTIVGAFAGPNDRRRLFNWQPSNDRRSNESEELAIYLRERKLTFQARDTFLINP